MFEYAKADDDEEEDAPITPIEVEIIHVLYPATLAPTSQ